jgi:hypothetical protein
VTHRGYRENERGFWYKAGRDLLYLAVAAAVFTLLFILGDLSIYGHVNW